MASGLGSGSGRTGGREDAAGSSSAGASSGVAPGKRTHTERLPAQRKAATSEPNGDAPPPPVSHDAAGAGDGGGAGDDPFGLHLGGGDGALPAPVAAEMEGAFGADFSAVRVHQGSEAASVGAHAYTQGTDIHFAPGQFAPHTPEGKELLGHELAHVMQQAQGRVAPTGDAGGVPLNDDPGLEQEADDAGARVARGENAGLGGGAASSSAATPAQRKAGGGAPAGEEAIEIGTSSDDAPPIQARSAGGPIQRKDGSHVVYKIHVDRVMTRAEFRATALRQVFGGPIDNVEWKNSKDSYGPDGSPYTLNVSTELLRIHRGETSKSKGISVSDDGKIAGADERAKTFHAGKDGDQKTALMNEIDRRYFDAVGDKTGTKIKAGEKGKSELWKTIRDEVLFQHEYIANLPPKVRELIKYSIKGKELTPEDYDKLFTIAKKIERMPPGQVGDYASKVTATTTDLDTFEAALDHYIAEMGQREKDGAERDTVKTKLSGLEEAYKHYKEWKAYPPGKRANYKNRVLKVELEKELQAHGFGGIDDFESYISRFLRAFEKESQNIAKDLLGKYAGRLFKEQERYNDPAEVSALYQKLGGVRKEYAEFEPNAAIWNEWVKTKDAHRIPGQGHMHPKYTQAQAEEARKKAEAARASAASQFAGVAGDHPIFQDDALPEDKRINRQALAKASESELGGLLQGHISTRMKVVGDARGEIEGNSDVIYKMDKLMPHFFAQQGIEPESIHHHIIRDKMQEDAIIKMLKGIAVAVVAVALAVVTFGAATPIIAAGAAVAGAGLSTYMALEEYKEYTQDKHLADVGFADDPSMIWLVLAVVGAGLDMGAAVKAVKALGPAAKALNTAGDLGAFGKAVKALEEAGEIEAKVARAAEKAAAAKQGFADASKDLGKALGKLYSFPGPLFDPEVWKALVKMARNAIKAGLADFEKFLAEIKRLRLAQKLGDLTPEELAKVKQAWEEAKVLEAAEKASLENVKKIIPDVAKAESIVAKVGDAGTAERLLKMFSESELDSILPHLKDPKQLLPVFGHVHPQTARQMMLDMVAKGKFDKLNQFVERMAAGAAELGETAAIGAKSLIIDSQAAIALVKDATGQALQGGEKAWVKYLKSLPDTELRVGNITVGEVQGGVIKVKGMPIDVAGQAGNAARQLPEYQRVLGALEAQGVGGKAGVADRHVIADALFAKTDPGVVPTIAIGDTNAVKNLARVAGMDVVKEGGYPGLFKKFGKDGFEVVLEGRTLKVRPLPPAGT